MVQSIEKLRMNDLINKFRIASRLLRMRNFALHVVVFSIGLSVSVSNAKSNCRNPDYESQAKQNECAVMHHAAADKALNNEYKRIFASLPKMQQKQLVLDQRKWLRMLDPNCKESIGDPERAGNMWSMEFHECLAQETEERTRILKSWLFR